MKRTITVLIYVCYIIYVTGCGAGGGGADSKAADPASPTIPGIVAPGPTTPTPGGTTTANLTYYTMVQTVNYQPVPAGTSYPITMTGHCVNYNSTDYCWDDGFQANASQPTHKITFWGLCEMSGVVNMCTGGIDPVTTPYEWSEMLGYMVTPLHFANDVYTHGIATAVTCTLNGSILDCVDFQIDTTQAPL